MKSSILLLFLATTALHSGCASRGEIYARQHPELSPAQVKFLKTGKAPDGDAVAGMTREQIQIAMGVEPTQYQKVDGHDAWVYVRKTLSTSNIGPANDATFNRRDNRSQYSMAEGESHAPGDQPLTKTTIYFDGERATRADVVNGGL